MDKRELSLLMLVAALILTGVVSAQPRLALVIGNAAYRTRPLRNPENDARDMAAALPKLGFEVILRVNSDYGQMQEAIYDFAVRLGRSKGVGLFYFAGHGVQIDGENYLLPLGMQIAGPQHLKSRAINLAMLLAAMIDAKNRMNIIILDACRNNPFTSERGIDRSLSLSRGLAVMEASAGVLIVYATSPGKVAADGNSRNGVFTKHLLRHLNSEAHIEDMLRQVRKAVYQETRGKQLPWSSSSLLEKFYFNPGAGSNHQQKHLADKPKGDKYEPSGKKLTASDQQRQLLLRLPAIFQSKNPGHGSRIRLSLLDARETGAITGKNEPKLPLLRQLALRSQAFIASEQARVDSCLTRPGSNAGIE